MKNDEAINVFETYLATGHVPYPYELREASRMAISALKGEISLPEDTVLFNKGVEEGKRLMMEEAVEYEVGMHGEPIEITFDKYVQRAKGIFPGDKVRIIICKKEE